MVKTFHVMRLGCFVVEKERRGEKENRGKGESRKVTRGGRVVSSAPLPLFTFSWKGG
jgi:hypothetical protein